MKKVNYLLIFILILLPTFFSFAQVNQDSILNQSLNTKNVIDSKKEKTSRHSNLSDTTQLATNSHLDSLRADLSKINIKYLSNIRAGALDEEAHNKKNRQSQFVEKINSFSEGTPKDSIESWTVYARSQISDLNSFQSTLSSYNNSLSFTLNQLKDFRAKYNLTAKNARLNRYLTTAEQGIASKMDSLKSTELLTKETLKAYHNLAKNAKTAAESIAKTEEKEANSAKSSLWKAGNSTVTKEKIFSNLKNNYQKNKSIDTYVNKTTWTSRILLIILTIAYLYWILSTTYVLFKNKREEGDTNAKFNYWLQLGKALVLFLTLLPLVSIVTPTLVIQLAQLLIMGVFALILRKNFNKKNAKFLGILLLFYVCNIFVNSVVSEDLIFRITCIAFNLIALYIGFYMKRTIKDPAAPGYIQLPIFVIFSLLNIIAIVLNILGYIDQSRSFSIAGAVGLVQSFTLTFFIHMIKEDVRKQFAKNRIKKGFWIRFNEDRALKSAGDALKFICIVLAIIVLANNLQFAGILVKAVSKFLNDSHKVGGISFSFGNLVLAIIILTIANWLQKNINLLLMGGENGEIRTDYDQKMTLFPLFRLIIIVVGFFIAISALGVSLDKLTVIIGALSVGIGLGMQNIINNFVSGIILVFDKPFRVGDQIELADKKGRVKEIGIRASVLNTGDGAEVVIPNGDLLSGRLVNWTLSDNFAKTSFVLQVDRKADLELSKTWIRQAIDKSQFSRAELGVGISVQDISEEMFYLSVSCWIDNSSNGGGFKSDVLVILSEQFKSAGLKFFSIAPSK